MPLFRTFVACLAAALALSAQVASSHSDSAVPGRVIVRHREGQAVSRTSNLFAAHRARVQRHIEQGRLSVLEVPAGSENAIRQSLERSGEFEAVEFDYYAHPAATSNDTSLASQWYLSKIGVTTAWDTTTGSSGVLIAVIDTGVDGTHPDLAGRLVPGWNFVLNSSDSSDVYGHGTAVAGVIGAATNNAKGVAGITWSNPMMSLVACDASASCSYSNMAAAMYYAADHGAKVINISLGGTATSSVLQSAVDYAWSKGVVIMASAMNNANSIPNYPAACTNVVAVSATDTNDSLAGYSNYGSWITVSAPGSSILTTSRGGGYGYWNGTSFASPVTAAVAALMLSANPALTPSNLVSTLKSSADDLGTPGFDNYFGWGRVNAARAVAAAGGSAVRVSMTPASASLYASGQQVFTATVTGTTNTGVTWSMQPALGSLSASGVYTAPASISSASWVTITATAVADPTRTATSTISLTPPPTITSLSVAPTSVAGGIASSATATLSSPAPPGGITVNLTSNNSAAAPVGSITIPQGSTSGKATINTTAVIAAVAVTITANTSGSTQTGTFTITPAALSSLTLSPVSTVGGKTIIGTVNLSGPAPAAGITVALSSADPATVSVPASVVVPSGAASAKFNATAAVVTANSAVSVTASYGGVDKSVLVTVAPPVLSSLSSTANVTGGKAVSGSVALTGAAPAAGALVQLTSSNPSVLSVPTTITVASGSTSAAFSFTPVVVTASSAVTISASYAGLTKTFVVTVMPPALSSIAAAPATLMGGKVAGSNAVSLTGPAGAGGAQVQLTSSNPSVIAVPSTLTIPAGAASLNFAFTPSVVLTNTTVTLSATYDGITKTVVITVVAPALNSVLIPSAVLGGKLSSGSLSLTGPAPAAGIVVQLSSSNPAVVSVPATVTIAAAGTTATFSFTPPTVTASTAVTISATYAGVTKTAVVSIEPPALYSFLTTATVLGGRVSGNNLVSLTGPAPAGGVVVPLTSSNPGVFAVPASVTIASGATSVGFNATVAAVSTSTTVTVTATLGSITKTVTVTVLPPVLSSLSIPTSVTGGNLYTTGSVSITGPAPAEGIVVQLQSANTLALPIPATVTVPAGSTSVTFSFTPSVVTVSTPVTVSASEGGVTKTVTATVL